MRHVLPRSRILAAGGALATLALLLGAACSGRAATPTATSVPHEGQPSGSATAATYTAPAGFCADWFKLAAESTRFGAAQNSSPAEPEVLRSSVEATTRYLKTLADSAPADIKTDFTTYAQWWSDFSAQMARVTYDFSQVTSDPELQKQMQATTEPKFTRASTNISAWVQRNCNILR